MGNIICNSIVTCTGGSRIAFLRGAVKLVKKTGVQGAGPLAGGCKGAEPPCVGKFCISELNSRDLVHTHYQHYIENLFIYFYNNVKYRVFFFFFF